MSLSISVHYIDPATGNEKKYDLGMGGDLMGFESFRHDYWGKPIMHEIGLKLLPLLKSKSLLICEGDELDILENDALLIQQNAELVMQHVNPDPIFLWHRTNNILQAVKVARELNGKIWIG